MVKGTKRIKAQVAETGKLSHTLITASPKSKCITEFFNVVGVEFPVSAGIVGKIFTNKIDSTLSEGDCSSNDGCDLKMDELFTATPERNKWEKFTRVQSPSTPHRIEYCEEQEKIKYERELQIEQVQIKNVTAKRRLNNNQSINQQPTSKQNKSVNNHKLTEYFPVRRSVRKPSKVVLLEKQRNLEDTLRKGIESGLKIQNFEGKGRGIVADKHFERGDFVVEYGGDLIDVSEAKRRELKYAQDQNTGCYMYYFKHKDQQHCIDATAESGRLGRLVNHSRNGNLATRTVDVDMKPHLVLIAKEAIEIGEEVTYDYGDRSKESLKHHPWLAY